MKFLLSTLFLFVTWIGFSQGNNQTIHVKNINCKYDTLVNFYEEVSLRIENDSIKNISVSAEGSHQILMIKILSKECECSDCSESFEFAITVDSLELNQPVSLNSKNLTWLYKNSWIQPQFITSFLGNITRTNTNSYSIILSELVGNTIIRKIILNVKR